MSKPGRAAFSKRATENCSAEMLTHYAITPSAFSEVLASGRAALELGIGCLNDLCRSEGLFPDLRDGQWGNSVEAAGPLGKGFLAFAAKNRRTYSVASEYPTPPANEKQWLYEAQAFHATCACGAIITHSSLAKEETSDEMVCSIEEINQTKWWVSRSPSKTVPRTTKGYMEAAALVLKHANSIMFIDAYVDPLAHNYREFPSLLLTAGVGGRKPLIEIHRASWRKIQGKIQVQQLGQWMADFEAWSQRLKQADLGADVFLWEKIHDRYLITDLIGINVPYGFDIGTDSGETSTWSRLGLAQRDKQQLEFDKACGVHRLAGSFHIGADAS